MDHRPLEGFVYAITPFNFTAIGGNLPTAPALMGNAVVWKPAATAALSNWYFYKLLEEAGLPPGVINFLPGDSIEVSRTPAGRAPISPASTSPARRRSSRALEDGRRQPGPLRGYPRIVGETGGKDFILAHASADVDALAVAHGARAPTSTRARSAARPPGPTSPTRSGPRCATGWWR